MKPPAVPTAVLLDTCAAIWLAEGSLGRRAVRTIVSAGLADGIFVSPISAWEVGVLSRPRGSQTSVAFLPDPKGWFANLMGGAGIKEAKLTGEIAIEASHLPGGLHGDPADRLLIATARRLGIPIVTRDSKIIDYGRHGFVKVIPC